MTDHKISQSFEQHYLEIMKLVKSIVNRKALGKNPTEKEDLCHELISDLWSKGKYKKGLQQCGSHWNDLAKYLRRCCTNNLHESLLKESPSVRHGLQRRLWKMLRNNHDKFSISGHDCHSYKICLQNSSSSSLPPTPEEAIKQINSQEPRGSASGIIQNMPLPKQLEQFCSEFFQKFDCSISLPKLVNIAYLIFNLKSQQKTSLDNENSEASLDKTDHEKIHHDPSSLFSVHDNDLKKHIQALTREIEIKDKNTPFDPVPPEDTGRNSRLFLEYLLYRDQETRSPLYGKDWNKYNFSLYIAYTRFKYNTEDDRLKKHVMPLLIEVTKNLSQDEKISFFRYFYRVYCHRKPEFVLFNHLEQV